MYAAIHKDGLVIFSTEAILNTSYVSNATQSINQNSSTDEPIFKPTGIVVTQDPWWIRLMNSDIENETKLKKKGSQNDLGNWDLRFRVKVATIPSTRLQFKTTSATTVKPFRATTQTLSRKSRTKPTLAPFDYDENSITYNYKSYP